MISHEITNILLGKLVLIKSMKNGLSWITKIENGKKVSKYKKCYEFNDIMR